jgi:hypothetical protein
MMEKKYKMSFKGIFEPTPSLFKRIGLALVAAATFGAGLTFVSDDKVLGITVFVLGAIGKFVTEFFSEQLIETKCEKEHIEEPNVESPSEESVTEEPKGDSVIAPVEIALVEEVKIEPVKKSTKKRGRPKKVK